MAISDNFLLDHQFSIQEVAKNNNSKYYVLTNGHQYYWFRTQNNVQLPTPVNYEVIKKEIGEIHEELFQFLESKRKDEKGFTYKLRSKNNDGRLEKGYSI